MSAFIADTIALALPELPWFAVSVVAAALVTYLAFALAEWWDS